MVHRRNLDKSSERWIYTCVITISLSVASGEKWIGKSVIATGGKVSRRSYYSRNIEESERPIYQDELGAKKEM